MYEITVTSIPTNFFPENTPADFGAQLPPFIPHLPPSTNRLLCCNYLILGNEKFRLFSEDQKISCLLYTSPSPRDKRQSRMPSSA